MRVLLIDDDDDIRRIGRAVLEKVGKFQTWTAASASEGIALAKVHRPTCILLDMMMPEMDGLATLAELKASHELSQIPVLFMTARIEARDVQLYLSRGAVGVIQKPFDPLTLPAEIRRILAARAAADGRERAGPQ